MKYNFDKVIERRGTDCVKYDLLKVLFGAEDVLPMWVADMDFEVPDFIREALKERLDHPIYGYTYRSESFNKVVASWMTRRHKWDIDPAWVDFSPGVVPALVLSVLAYSQPGDKVLVQSPVYFPFFSSVEKHQRELVNSPLIKEGDDYFIDFEDLEKQFMSGVKLMLFCHPHNPVSRVWTKDELQRLGDLAVKYHVILLSDEIHSDLVLFGHQHIPLASLSEQIAEQTVTCIAASKTFNLAGFHTSALIISNSELRKKYKQILDDIHVGGGNLLGPIALEAAYTHGEEWLEQLKAYIEGNYLFLKAYIEKECPVIKVQDLQATYLVWMDFKALGMSDDELMKFMVGKAKLALNDGPRFGSGGEGFLRMNIACPREVLVSGLNSLSKAINAELLEK